MIAASYSATRNLYPLLPPAIKSLLRNSPVEKVYLLLEDDDPGFALPAECQVINVSGQTDFRPDGPNYVSHWTWMVLMKMTLYRRLPELDRILTLDVDTIVAHDISELWELDLDGYLYAAAREPAKCRGEQLYVNAGVLMHNLALLRSSGWGDELVKALNRRAFNFPEQDLISTLGPHLIREIGSTYNAGGGTAPVEDPKIYHFMGIKPWTGFAIWHRYNAMSWEDVRPCV